MNKELLKKDIKNIGIFILLGLVIVVPITLIIVGSAMWITTGNVFSEGDKITEGFGLRFFIIIGSIILIKLLWEGKKRYFNNTIESKRE